MSRQNAPRRRMLSGVAGLLVSGLILPGISARPAAADSYQRISGEGSSWAANAIDAMRVDVQQFGITVDYNPSGSTAGRTDFRNGTVDFAASDIPFQFNPEDGSAPENPVPGSYAYMPVVAGGTAFMYNLKINGKRVTNLRLSGQNVAKIFTGVLTTWNDPAIQADNPGITLPARTIVPVVRSDGSGSTAQFTMWMIHQYPDIWNTYCQHSDHAPACGSTSFYPAIQGMILQSGDTGIAGYVKQGFAEGAIGYVNYSYAVGNQFPVAKVLNAAGYYTEPTPQNVAVSLLKAKINTDASNPAVYLTQQLDGVYTDTDPRNYQLSSYSYLILPTVVGGQFNEAKGKTLGAFSYYAMCQAQQQSASLGYSPMPINLVQASFDQITKIPGVVVQNIDITKCNNPTFASDGSNKLADTAPQPLACDRQGATQCPNGTGGLSNVATPVSGDAPSGVPTASTVVIIVTPTPATAAPGVATATTAPKGGVTATTAPAARPTATTVAGGVTATTVAGVVTATTVAGGGTPADSTGTSDTTAPGGATASTVAAGASTGQNCDGNTGACGTTPGAPSTNADPAPVPAAATPTTLARSSGWDASLALILLVIVLTLALVLAPALSWRYFSRTGPVAR